MIKAFSKIIGVLLGSVLLAGTTFAAGINAGIGAQQYMTKTGVNIVPIVTTYEFGSTTRRWAKGWFTDLDVSGVFTFGGAMATNLHFPDDLYATFGNTAAAPDAGLGWNTTQTVDGLYLRTATGQNTLIIAENGDVAYDFAHGAQTNPTVFIHSAAQNTTQWLGLYHDGTNGIIQSGSGPVRVINNLALFDDTEIRFGTGADVFMSWDTSDADAHYFNIAVQNVSRNIIISEDINVDWTHAAQTNPTLWIQSANSADTNEYISFVHNQTDAIITSGQGLAIIDAPSGVVLRDNSVTALGASSNGTTATWNAASGDNILITTVGANANLSFTQVAGTTGSTGFTFNIGAHTAITTATERIGINVPAVTKTWAAGAGPLATQREIVFNAPTYVGDAGGALTIALATSFSTQLPIAGANLTETVAAGIGVVAAVGGAGTITGTRGIFIEDQSLAGGTTSYALNILSQTANATTTRAINIVGTGANNAIELGDSPLIYSSGAEVIRFDDSTAARGISFTLTAAGNQTIAATAGGLTLNNNRVGIGIAAGANSDVLIGASANDVAGYRMSVGYTDTSTTGTIRALNSEMTANPGAASDASYQSVSINTYTSVGLAQNLTGSLVGGAYFVENRLNAANTLTLAAGSSAGFTNTTGITTTAHGYRSIIVVTAGTVTNGAGFFVRPPTNAGTLVNMYGLDVSDVSLAGGTTAYGVRVQSQTANATTTRAIEIAGTGVNNAIRLGASPNIYSSAAQTIRMTDSTDANGLSIVLAAGADQTINTVATTTGAIILQNQTFTAGALHDAVQINPTWTAEAQIHRSLRVTPTQNGAASRLVGIFLALTKATGATILDNANNIYINPLAVTGTVTAATGITIDNQSSVGGTTAYALEILSQTANATTTRAINLAGQDANNGFQLGATGVLITNDGDGAITFLGASAGADEDFIINLDDTANTIALSSSTGVTDIRWDTGVGVGQFTLDGSTGGCIMLRDTDDAGWTEVDALDGVLTASIDADGTCD